MKIKEDDVVLCKVKKIEGTTVFLDIEGNGQGSMVLSEVAAGRIRNLRDYVSPNRKIVCKILKISGDRVELSLRRVTAKEREEVLEESKRERALRSMLKIIEEEPEKLIEKIKEDGGVVDFLDEAREDIKVLEKLLSKDKAKKLFQIISEKETREKSIERRFVLKTFSDSGVSDIREILDVRGCEIHYLGSSKFSVSVSGKDFREANVKMENVLEEVEKRAKKKEAEFEVKKEK